MEYTRFQNYGVVPDHDGYYGQSSGGNGPQEEALQYEQPEPEGAGQAAGFDSALYSQRDDEHNVYSQPLALGERAEEEEEEEES